MTTRRDGYGALHFINDEPVKATGGMLSGLFERAEYLVKLAGQKNKIPRKYDHISWDRKGRASGNAVCHELYDIQAKPLKVLVCVRETEGSKYGVRTVSKNYYIIYRWGKGLRVKEANKHRAALLCKSAGKELGLAIKCLETGEAIPKKPNIVYKQVAKVEGEYFSVYDGSKWRLGEKRSQAARSGHGGGFYAHETAISAYYTVFPSGSAMRDEMKAILECEAWGKRIEYDNGKVAFTHLKPVKELYHMHP